MRRRWWQDAEAPRSCDAETGEAKAKEGRRFLKVVRCASWSRDSGSLKRQRVANEFSDSIRSGVKCSERLTLHVEGDGARHSVGAATRVGGK